MTTYIFDLEGNGLNELRITKKGTIEPECNRVHCLVLRSFPDGGVQVFRNNGEEDTIAEGWAILREADVVIGHNIIGYDLPMLRRLYGGDVTGSVFDTLVAARVLWPDAKNHPFGGNSLKAFGELLKVWKGDYDGGWEEWSEDMESYCVQDTVVSAAIYSYVLPKIRKHANACKLEHRVATIVARMQENGVTIDVAGAEALAEQMEMEQATALAKLQEAFPPRIETLKTPQYWFLPDGDKPSTHGRRWSTKTKAPAKLRSLLKRGPLKTKEHPFNPNSSGQIADRLEKKYGWVAPRTEAGNASVTEEVLRTVDFPEAELLLRAQMADKRLQHLTDWITRARNSRTPGRIHPQINSCGTNTSRGTHQQPNQTACPKVLDPTLRGYEGRYGWEMRSLWGPRAGWWQVGADASGLELRCLGAALAPYDGGKYGHDVIHGDVHTRTMEAGGLSDRNLTKTVTYATLYGAGDAHLDDLIGQKGSGKRFRKGFESAITGYDKLKAWCMQCASERGFIPLPDGRHAPVRSEHSALNVYLQGMGAIIMKTAMVLTANTIDEKGWADVGWMLWPHDEFQLEAASEERAHDVGRTIVASIRRAGEVLGIQCPLDGEYKVGHNWAETH
jgi:DNA polymerase I-like protein with 3'-5' exonuclease and polymerase domains